MAKKLSILNFISVLLVIVVNYYSQMYTINGNTMASLSAEYDNLFTPAGYAFAIWGLIFLAMFAYAIFQIKRAFFSDKKSDFIEQTGPYFFIANLANASWVVVWLYEYTFISIILMFIILISLLMVVIKTNMERWDAPIKIIAFVWWPICLYSGWIAVAAIANVAAYLSKIGWNGGFLNEVQWTMVMLTIAIFLNILIIYKRNMREFASVGIWALIAIYMRQQGSHDLIAYYALIGAVLIFLNVAYHGYLNRETNPFKKMMN
ncbi:hypothetical protein SAMN04487764_0571 [Gillisia sp. Hel1_33_143]|uniref:hypothetical protein n=1 Tax=Gillisia sp. Hel1_33_143 TaxID=1336796 RepID=UPI00087C76DF|nr:hypothetical protein [Gillisia sp. Hel1_33_143]SDR76079.1 hypothetical protein SAMN04487764_0571 [Gillisia sp. Hel1_33_143]